MSRWETVWHCGDCNLIKPKGFFGENYPPCSRCGANYPVYTDLRFTARWVYTGGTWWRPGTWFSGYWEKRSV